jgi:hypothetical protein
LPPSFFLLPGGFIGFRRLPGSFRFLGLLLSYRFLPCFFFPPGGCPGLYPLPCFFRTLPPGLGIGFRLLPGRLLLGGGCGGDLLIRNRRGGCLRTGCYAGRRGRNFFRCRIFGGFIETPPFLDA